MPRKRKAKPKYEAHLKEQAASAYYEFWHHHWDKGGEVPKSTVIFDDDEEASEVPFPFVAEAALPFPKHPILIKEEYPVILSKLQGQLDLEKEPQPVENSVIRDGAHIDLAEPKSVGGPMIRTRPGICIFGHPGSGKSTSLLYLLIAKLRRKQPVVYVKSKRTNMILFTEKGPASVSEAFVNSLCLLESALVILYDATAREIPIEWWGNQYVNFHMVLATSPQVTCFKHWIKNGVNCLTVEPFSRLDLQILVKLYPQAYGKGPENHHPLDVYDHLGPNLKLLMGERGIVPKTPNSSLYEDFARKTQQLSRAIQGVDSDLWIKSAENPREFLSLDLKAEPGEYHEIFVVRRVPHEGPLRKQWTDSPFFDVRLISVFMAWVFIGAVKLRGIRDQMAFAAKFIYAPALHGLICELSSIRFLSWAPQEITIVVNGQEELKLSPYLRTSLELLDFKKQPPPRRNHLHVAPIGATGIDGLFESKDGRKVLFQMTVAKKHDVSSKGIQEVLNCYRTKKPEISLEDFILVFVVPDLEKREEYLSKHSEGLKFQFGTSDEQTLRVGALVISSANACTIEDMNVTYDSIAKRVIDKDGNKRKIKLRPRPGNKTSSVPTTASHPAYENALISGDNLLGQFDQPLSDYGSSNRSSSTPAPTQPARATSQKRGNSASDQMEDAASGPSNPKRKKLNADKVTEAQAPPAPITSTRGRGRDRGRG